MYTDLTLGLRRKTKYNLQQIAQGMKLLKNDKVKILLKVLVDAGGMRATKEILQKVFWEA